MICKTSINKYLLYVICLLCATAMIATESNSIGTIITLALLFLVVFLCLSDGKAVCSKNNAVFLLSLLFCLNLLFNNPLTDASLYSSIKVTALFICFALLWRFSANYSQIEIIKRILLISVFVYGLIIIYSNISSERRFHGDLVLFGTSFDPNFIGIPFVYSSAICFYSLLFIKKKRISHLFDLLLLLEAFLIILLSASRGSFLGFIICNGLILVYYLFNKNVLFSKKFALVAFLVILIFLAIFLAQNYFLRSWERINTIGKEGSDNSRFVLWGQSISLWVGHPLLGAGYYSNYSTFGKATHNTFLMLLSETGFLGFLIFVIILFMCFKKAYLFSDKSFFFALVGVVCLIFFLDALDNRPVWCFLYVIALLPTQRKRIKN